MAEYTAHPTAVIDEGAKIGKGTKVWHFVHVRGSAIIGEGCNIGKSSYIDANAKIGDRVKIQNFVSVYHGVEIGNDVFVGPSVVFTNDKAPRAAVWDESRLVKTLVKEGASIGANATIICGITLGEWCMVGAGSVATRDVKAHELVHGNPARHQGWVCFCGKKMDGEGPLFKCECGKSFRVQPKTAAGE